MKTSYQMTNMVWSIGEYDDQDQFQNSYKAEDVFWNNAITPKDGTYPWLIREGLVGELKIVDGVIDVEHLNSQIPSEWMEKNDHIFVELMVLNKWGVVEIWLGS